MKLCIGPEKSSKKSKKSQPIAALDQNDVPAGAEEEKEEAFQYDSDEVMSLSPVFLFICSFY